MLALTILVVLMLLMISAWYILDGRDEDLYHNISVDVPVVSSRMLNGTKVWDCRVVVNKVEVGVIYPPRPVDGDLFWNDVHVQVHAKDGTLLVFNTPLFKMNEVPDTVPAVAFIEQAGGSSTIDVGDAIGLFSLDARFAFAYVALFYPVDPPGGYRDLMCEFKLPAVFP